MSVRRPCRLSQVASSLLIFRPGSWPAPRSISCTTMVRSGAWFLGALGGGGCGTSASRPFGVSGVITMKMMSSTRSTSMSGVTLIFALWPPPEPIDILIVDLLLFQNESLPRRSGCARGLRRIFSRLGKQAEIIYTGGSHSIDYLHHVAVVSA